MTTCLVFFDGILRDHRGRPIQEGIWLTQLLATGNRVFISTVRDRAYAERELRNDGLLEQVVDILDDTLVLNPVPLWQRHIEVVRNRGPITWLFSADPQVVQWAVERGVVSMFFAHPRFGGPARRPDIGNRSWEQLVEELDDR